MGAIILKWASHWEIRLNSESTLGLSRLLSSMWRRCVDPRSTLGKSETRRWFRPNVNLGRPPKNNVKRLCRPKLQITISKPLSRWPVTTAIMILPTFTVYTWQNCITTWYDLVIWRNTKEFSLVWSSIMPWMFLYLAKNLWIANLVCLPCKNCINNINIQHRSLPSWVRVNQTSSYCVGPSSLMYGVWKQTSVGLKD